MYIVGSKEVSSAPDVADVMTQLTIGDDEAVGSDIEDEDNEQMAKKYPEIYCRCKSCTVLYLHVHVCVLHVMKACKANPPHSRVLVCPELAFYKQYCV